jgi:hypothetical protein
VRRLVAGAFAAGTGLFLLAWRVAVWADRVEGGEVRRRYRGGGVPAVLSRGYGVVAREHLELARRLHPDVDFVTPEELGALERPAPRLPDPGRPEPVGGWAWWR